MESNQLRALQNTSWSASSHVRDFRHRMDRDDLEPGDRLHEDKPGMQALLRREDVEAAPGHGSRRSTKSGFSLATHESSLDEPLRWKKPRLVFVNSMSDLFHKSAPSGFIESVFDVMNRATQHTFQVLTKRPGRATSARQEAELDAQHLARRERRIRKMA